MVEGLDTAQEQAAKHGQASAAANGSAGNGAGKISTASNMDALMPRLRFMFGTTLAPKISKLFDPQISNRRH